MNSILIMNVTTPNSDKVTKDQAIANTSTNSVYLNFGYSYDRTGNLFGRENYLAEKFTKFFFDNANRLNGITTEETLPGVVVEEGGLSEAALEALAVTNENVLTDANGNIVEMMIDDKTYSFSYDYENRLVEARYPDDLVIEFLYDGFGRRVITRVNGEGVRHIYNGYLIVQDRKERTDELVAEYTYFQGNIFKIKRGTTERWVYNYPEGGWPRHLFDNEGTRTDSLDMGWFGDVAYRYGSSEIGIGWAGGWTFAYDTAMPFVFIPESNEIWMPKLAKSLNPLVKSDWSLEYSFSTKTKDPNTDLHYYESPNRLPVRDILKPIRRPKRPGMDMDNADANTIPKPICCTDISGLIKHYFDFALYSFKLSPRSHFTQPQSYSKFERLINKCPTCHFNISHSITPFSKNMFLFRDGFKMMGGDGMPVPHLPGDWGDTIKPWHCPPDNTNEFTPTVDEIRFCLAMILMMNSNVFEDAFRSLIELLDELAKYLDDAGELIKKILDNDTFKNYVDQAIENQRKTLPWLSGKLCEELVSCLERWYRTGCDREDLELSNKGQLYYCCLTSILPQIAHPEPDITLKEAICECYPALKC